METKGDRDPLCDDAAGRPSGAILKEISETILAYLEEHIQSALKRRAEPWSDG